MLVIHRCFIVRAGLDSGLAIPALLPALLHQRALQLFECTTAARSVSGTNFNKDKARDMQVSDITTARCVHYKANPSAPSLSEVSIMCNISFVL